jgi:hypothetical protein
MTADDVTPSVDAPAVFTRVLSTPPGLPWDQARVARLEAARAAPVAIQSLTLRLKRLVPWRNGKAGAFVAFYVKTEALGGGFRASRVIDGRTVTVEFKSRAQAKAEARLVAVFAGVGAASAVITLAAVITAVAVRHGADNKLDDLAGRSAQQLRQAQVLSAMKRQNSALRRADNSGAPVSEILADLASASRARRQEAPVEGFHWRPAGFGVEVRGDAQPFTGFGAVRSTRPLKPGVWLWIKARGSAVSAGPQGASR